jgi:hypothetical protein
MLHWIDDQMTKQDKQNDNIKSAFVSWIVPILASATVAGLILFAQGM